MSGNSTVYNILSIPGIFPRLLTGEFYTVVDTPEEIEQLSLIIQELNLRFGTDFTDEDKVFIRQLEEKLAGDSALKASVHVNPPENVRLTFDHVVNDRLQDMIDSNFKFYKQVTDNQEFSKTFLVGYLSDISDPCNLRVNLNTMKKK